MPRAKKDGRRINYFIDRQIFEAVEAYAQANRYPVTTAFEILLEKGLALSDCTLKQCTGSVTEDGKVK